MLRSLSLLLAAVAGCATGPTWLPSGPDNGVLRGADLPEAVYPLGDGEVRVAAVGVRREPTEGRRKMVLRMRVRNDSDTPLRLDLREQRLVLPGDRELLPELGSFGGVPLLGVPAHGEATADLLYDIGGEKPKRFDFRWTVATPHDYVARRTSFERELPGAGASYGPLYVNGWYYAPPFYDAAAGNRHGFPPIATRGEPTGERTHGRRVRIVPATPPIETPPVARP